MLFLLGVDAAEAVAEPEVEPKLGLLLGVECADAVSIDFLLPPPAILLLTASRVVFARFSNFAI